MGLEEGDHHGEGDALVAVDEGVGLGDADAVEGGQVFAGDVLAIGHPVRRAGEGAFEQGEVADAGQAAEALDQPGVPVHRQMRRNPAPGVGHFAKSS